MFISNFGGINIFWRNHICKAAVNPAIPQSISNSPRSEPLRGKFLKTEKLSCNSNLFRPMESVSLLAGQCLLLNSCCLPEPWFVKDYKHYFFFLKFYFICKLYITVLDLPNIKMNPPQVYMCSPSWTHIPPPSPFHPSGSSQCTGLQALLCLPPPSGGT